MKFMHILPENKQDWVAVSLLPFKAYTILAPFMYKIFLNLCASCYRHYHSGDEQAFIATAMLMFPCAAILLFAALGFVVVGSKSNARSCIGFGIAALILGFCIFPDLAHT